MDLHAEAERLAAVERGKRLLLAALDTCATGRQVASKHLCAEARDHIMALYAHLTEVERERDEARARVAAAYEEAAQDVEEWGRLCAADGTNLTPDVVADIRALTRPEETDALDRIRAEAVAPNGNAANLPDHGNNILIAWKWSGGIGFSVGHYWYDDDDMVLKDDEGFVICDPTEVVGWWELDRFVAAIREDKT